LPAAMQGFIGCSTSTGCAALRYGLLALIVMALVTTAFFSAADGDAGQKVAVALEEMSLVMVLLLLHLIVSRFHGDGADKKLTAKKLATDDFDQGPADDSASMQGQAEEPNQASEEWQEREIGLLTTKIRGAVRLGDMKSAEAIMEHMQEIGGQPGRLRRACWAVSFGEIVSGFVRAGDAESAGRWLDAFASCAPLIRPSTVCVNSVISAFGAKGDLAQAEDWLARMPLIGVKVDEETYTVIIEACVSAGDIQRAIYWLREMRKSNMRPGAEIQKLVLQKVTSCDTASAKKFAAPTGIPSSELSR